MSKKFLIIGSSGQLATEFITYFSENDIEYSAPQEKDLDISDAAKLEAVILQEKPDVILNCAAYNQVDKAEEEQSIAFKINSQAVENLALLCKKQNVFLVHYSSDYVFDGKKGNLYIESDAVNPLNVYGKSKFKGEEAILKHLDKYLIFRLSWVIGCGSQNFLFKLQTWAKEKEVLHISADEVSVPTYTEDVVDVTLMSIEKQLSGLYHLTNSGYSSRYELAKYFIVKMGLGNIVIPVPMSTFVTKAPRPAFSAMSNAKISKQLGVTIPKWEYGVDRLIKIIKQ
ncbi:MAG: dTDP-4-dehydrorhamnose reductase [Candidatus Omnitrophota bacterium]|jgi:dTDP-4-dehydrorhamnose reductase